MPAAHRRLLGAVSATALITAVAWVLPASAAEPMAVVDQGVVSGAEGTVETLTLVDVAPEEIGSTCTLAVRVENQFSVHPGNDLLVTTNDVQTVIADVEAKADGDRDLTAELVMGPTLLVQMRFGPDEVSSLGFEITVGCDGSPPVAPLVEVTTTSSVPDGCPDPTGASLSLLPGGCPQPMVLPTVIENTTTAPSSPAPPPTAPARPSPTVPATATTIATTTTATTTTTLLPTTTISTEPTTTEATTPPASAGGPTPTVEGVQIFRGLPQTPAASAVPAQPAYTG